jgi:hypothetical protein
MARGTVRTLPLHLEPLAQACLVTIVGGWRSSSSGSGSSGGQGVACGCRVVLRAVMMKRALLAQLARAIALPTPPKPGKPSAKRNISTSNVDIVERTHSRYTHTERDLGRHKHIRTHTCERVTSQGGLYGTLVPWANGRRPCARPLSAPDPFIAPAPPPPLLLLLLLEVPVVRWGAGDDMTISSAARSAAARRTACMEG